MRRYWQEVKSIPVASWLLIAFTALAYNSIEPLIAFTSDMLQARFNLSSVDAGSCYGYLYLISGVWLVLTGMFGDAQGHLGVMQMFGAACALGANLWWVLHSNSCI